MIHQLSRIYRNLIFWFWLFPYSVLNRLKTFNPNNGIYIFAMGRGGSTLFMEMLNNSIKNSYSIWEPLAAGGRKIPALRKFNFTNLQYIPSTDLNKKLKMVFKQLFNNQLLMLSLTYHNKNLLSIPFKNRAIIKFCRGNLMLPWLIKNFNIKPLLLTRSPYSLINSQLNHNAYSELIKNPTFVLPKNTPNLKFYNQYQHIFRKCNSIEEHLAIKWCLNMLILKNPDNNIRWLTIAYENLIDNPRYSIERIEKFLNISINHESAIDSLQKTSKTGSTGKKSSLTQVQIEKINSILRDFELDMLYTIDDKPTHFLYNQYG